MDIIRALLEDRRFFIIFLLFILAFFIVEIIYRFFRLGYEPGEPESLYNEIALERDGWKELADDWKEIANSQSKHIQHLYQEIEKNANEDPWKWKIETKETRKDYFKTEISATLRSWDGRENPGVLQIAQKIGKNAEDGEYYISFNLHIKDLNYNPWEWTLDNISSEIHPDSSNVSYTIDEEE